MMRQFTTVTRADFEFMADDIGHEIVAVMEPEEMLQAMDAKKRQKLLSLLDPKDRLADVSVKDRLADVSVKDRLADISMDELVQGMSPSERKQLLERLIETLTSSLIDSEKQSNDN
ncbi:MAG: hypothetical protein KDE19_23085 [Caldilineaceae bacterium]|nr:hypothetical protein [Caldilineaceae bacterium]